MPYHALERVTPKRGMPNCFSEICHRNRQMFLISNCFNVIGYDKDFREEEFSSVVTILVKNFALFMKSYFQNVDLVYGYKL